MEAALRLAIWCILLLCGVIQNVLAASEIIPKDYTNMLCDLASGKEGICVFAYLCNDGVINTNGTAILDLRYMDVCKDYFLKCCSKESPCMERAGTCLPKNQCTADLEASKYTEFKESEECDWSGYQCCPNDAAKQTCMERAGTCLPKNQCSADLNASKYKEFKESDECELTGYQCCPNEAVNQVLLNSEQISSRDIPTVSVDDLDIKECGYRNKDGIKFNTINRNDGEAQYGEFPWVVAILLADSGKVKLRCAGTLIDPEIVLTTAECIREYKRKPEQLIIRAGEWDMAATMEPIPPQERRVTKMKIHDKFNPHSLVNNIALLFLDDKFHLTPTINTVCLPPQDFSIDKGYVIATGWGTTPQNRTKYQHILKSMELPYRQKSDCELILKRATRNNRLKLDSSFICAGGEFGQDTCQGDAGSPIIFPIPDTSDLRYYAVGMVSWGVGCGRPGIPSVNTDIGMFREWIDSKIDEEQLHMHYYDFQPQD
nr:phenoloxidase-activating factor 2-like [Aedes albopictus]XP_029713339.1 phenoloxidase-activating factor 2-like [Aedes albopictus]